MKIALLTLGTRGDVQPYAVLGKALKDRGHQVTISTARNFEALVNSYGLDFQPVDADFQSFLDSEEGKKMRKNPFRAKKNLAKWVHPMIYDALTTFYSLARENDKVLFHVKTLADMFADQFPGKMIMANVIPAVQPTREFSNPVLSALNLPSFLNKMTFSLTTAAMKSMHKKPIMQFRQNEGLPLKINNTELPSIYGISSHYLEIPKDFPENIHFTGFWNSASQEEPEEDLTSFIREGNPPLLISFGSMPFDTKLDLPAALARLNKELGIRIIVVKGWGLNNTGDLEKNPWVKVIESVPYDKIFPLVKAVVHHGGIGTIAACLQAGKPFLSCPVMYPMGDQHFWGMIGYKRGVGLKPVPLKRLTEDLLLSNVKLLLEKEELYTNSKMISEKLLRESGIQNAINIIESDDR